MQIRRFAITFATAAALAGSAFAAAPATTPAPTGSSAPAATPASTKVTGAVKAWNAQTHQLTVTVNNKDTVYSTTGLTLDPAVKVGATVDVTLNGAKVTAVALHKA